jgi:hypothetical protein
LSCLLRASGGLDRKLLYSAFIAASVLQAHILEGGERLLSNLPAEEIPVHMRHLPAVSRLCRYPPSSEHFTFEILCVLPDLEPYRLLYLAETPDKQLILIKFTERYSIQLHEFCAQTRQAPQIYAFERLPGGWFAVAMEFIEAGVPITQSEHLPTCRDRWVTELELLMERFHEQGLVHGDLRDANIICKEDSMMLIDFDWGGEDGKVSYPTLDLDDDLLQGRDSDSLVIRKEDDRRVFKNTRVKIMGLV